MSMLFPFLQIFKSSGVLSLSTRYGATHPELMDQMQELLGEFLWQFLSRMSSLIIIIVTFLPSKIYWSINDYFTKTNAQISNLSILYFFLQLFIAKTAFLLGNE